MDEKSGKTLVGGAETGEKRNIKLSGRAIMQENGGNRGGIRAEKCENGALLRENTKSIESLPKDFRIVYARRGTWTWVRAQKQDMIAQGKWKVRAGKMVICISADTPSPLRDGTMRRTKDLMLLSSSPLANGFKIDPKVKHRVL